MSAGLRIGLTFPAGYSGANGGEPEELPSFARLHEAFVAAAAGGPWAEVDGRVLVASAEHRDAVAWLEEHEPEAIAVPPVRLSVPTADRYRRRASPMTLVGSAFEPRSTLRGEVAYYWPAAPYEVVQHLRVIASEVTHVGRADSVVTVDVRHVEQVRDERLLVAAAGRGPGRLMAVPVAGRVTALEEAHRDASRVGRHDAGPMGKQAPDHMVTGANDAHTVVRRYAPAGAEVDWPYSEVLEMAVRGRSAAWALRSPRRRVAAAVAVHRALVRAIGTDVPAFVTGRDGAGPLRGAGHLAIQIVADRGTGNVSIALAVPPHVQAADRARLVEQVERGLRVRLAGIGDVSLGSPQWRSATRYWESENGPMHLATPMVLDVPGHPKRGPWSLEDGVVASIGFAFRGVLERAGVEWQPGWAFRRDLVARLREEWGVAARAERVHGPAGAHLHRAPRGDLLVAAHAEVRLGRLAAPSGGFVALGRARHLGGGLLVPVGTVR